VKDIYDEVCQSLWQTLEVNSVCIALMTCMYQYTWASSEGLSGVIHTRTGSCAGTPVADLMYVVAISKVIFKLRKRLEADELNSSIEVAGVTCDLLDVGYVDDTAIPIVASCAELVNKTTMIAKTACAVFASFFMQLNFNPGKSEAMATWRGKGAKLERRRLARDGNVSSFYSCERMYQLRFVDRYRHLGTVTTVCNNDNAEVAIRSTILRTEARKLAKNILGNECITAKRRCDLATCYIWSKGLFQCGTWARLACPTYKRIHGAIMYVYRCIGKYQHNMYKSDDEIIAQLGVMCPKHSYGLGG